MNENNHIKELVEKLMRLAESSNPNEAKNAKAKMEKLMTAHGLTHSDFEDDKIKSHIVHGIKTNWDNELLCRIYLKIVGNKAGYFYSRKKRGVRILDCKSSEIIEIEYLFSFYKNLYEKDLELMKKAFVYKHNLFPKEVKESKVSPNSKEAEELRKMAKMQMAMSDDSPLKAIQDSRDVKEAK